MLTGLGGPATRLAALAASGVLVACTSAGQEAEPEAADPASADVGVTVPPGATRVLHLDMEGVTAPRGAVVPRVSNAIRRKMRISVATAADGRARVGDGPDGRGRSLRFPPFSQAEPAPAAGLLVRAPGSWDALAPGRRAFRFGARFKLDATSAGSEADDGDNLVQRGLSGDEAQYKLQIDDGVPSCLVRGSDGEAFAKASREVARDTWYEASCRRTPEGVRLRVARVDGRGEPITARSGRDPGRVRPDREVPLSVATKVSPDGEVTTSSTDQFNGSVDDVFFEYQR